MGKIQLDGVTRLFGKVVALEDVSLQIRDREIITIVGPSGCGKSTLLRIIAGLEQPTSGEIWIDAERVTSLPARSRDLAMVFQSYALYPHMTCRENLALSLRLKKTPPHEVGRRVRETAAMLEIENLLEKKPRELSGGQRQRVALGRALIRHPRAFLFDEPLSNLDALLRERVRHELKELFQRIEATVIYVTHDQTEALTLADRVVVLDRGKIQQVGSPDELYRFPQNRFVASFIGSPSMNIFEAPLREGRFQLGPQMIDTGLDVSGRVDVGIRPEAIRLGPGTAGAVSWIENLGAHSLVGVRIGNEMLTAVVADRLSSGSVSVSINGSDVHVFDKNSGTNLSLDRDRRPAGS